jgi:hypothetical protein
MPYATPTPRTCPSQRRYARQIISDRAAGRLGRRSAFQESQSQKHFRVMK